jgi:hypothetical protein
MRRLLDPLLITYCLTALIEDVVDTIQVFPVLAKEPAVDQAPEIENAAWEDLVSSTLIDPASPRVPLVSHRLQRFIEGHVGLQFARRIVCVFRVDMVGVTERWNAENDLVSREAGCGPSLDG